MALAGVADTADGAAGDGSAEDAVVEPVATKKLPIASTADARNSDNAEAIIRNCFMAAAPRFPGLEIAIAAAGETRLPQ